ncbi:MAG: shikimate dehydrogenase [Nitrososphaerales archaeon]
MPLRINSETRLLGLIGYPVKQSLSPAIQNAAIRKLGLKALYLAFEVKEEDLSDAVKGFKALNSLGFNVTIPHKLKIIQYLDELDTLAEQIGAVNTVVNKGNNLIGYNTDFYGIVNPILKKGWKLEGEKIALIGAGGASLACIFALKYLKVSELFIINRTLKKALELSNRAKIFGLKAEGLELNEENLKEVLKEVKMLINATPIGMYPNIKESPLGDLKLGNVEYVFDMVYNPVNTRLLERAKEEGKEVIFGYEMLIEQAKESFKLWFQIEPNFKVMVRAFFKEIKNYDKG